MAFLALAGWAVIKNREHFDPVAMGTGIAAVLAAGGAALAMKHKTEPDE